VAALNGVNMTTTLSWVFVVLAGLLEVCWAVGLKYTEGFTKLIPTIFTLTTLAASMILLAKASQVLPIGIAYGVWVGIGALGAAVMGIFLLNEPASASKIFFLLLLLVSIIGLKVSSNT
jgi:quaternary ammonium compound-resistance protein SugE